VCVGEERGDESRKRLREKGREWKKMKGKGNESEQGGNPAWDPAPMVS
jgi:hypothetical protein